MSRGGDPVPYPVLGPMETVLGRSVRIFSPACFVPPDGRRTPLAEVDLAAATRRCGDPALYPLLGWTRCAVYGTGAPGLCEHARRAEGAPGVRNSSYSPNKEGSA